MKDKNRIHPILRVSPALALLLAVVGCASSRPQVAQEQKYIRLYHIADTGTEANLKKGDAVAMVCIKCKTVLNADIHQAHLRDLWRRFDVLPRDDEWNFSSPRHGEKPAEGVSA